LDVLLIAIGRQEKTKKAGAGISRTFFHKGLVEAVIFRGASHRKIGSFFG
jgi:hypothetical protein